MNITTQSPLRQEKISSDRLWPLELFSYIGLNNSDALIRPKIIYDLKDSFELLLGLNLFLGDEGQFGQYNDNDMIYTKITYSF